MAVPEVAIELADVALQFGRVRALDRLTLEVPRGIVFGFLGPNGAGKTSTLRVLLGLVRANAGATRVLGLDPVTEAPRVRAQVGVLLENDGLYDRLTALANLECSSWSCLQSSWAWRVWRRLPPDSIAIGCSPSDELTTMS